ncbi:phosphate acetyltransferase [Moraxella bovoculi]|uniref:Phosphate acetyltransferase n=1 Tax=Moraxella bovoculi TaxID=386891 RepID=A0AAC8PUL6_9GAMM|nr:phosphate acetyltransferase [Moraxella bovoculi]AKG10119.1 phosphate acetyltransferase [Moraxella bovoculi]AKG12041.1 phosphate acetyltransferase [Moraxella bovoculi]AKG14009.1 phosphate acetyltransferase [Moraxella bovoculi]
MKTVLLVPTTSQINMETLSQSVASLVVGEIVATPSHEEFCSAIGNNNLDDLLETVIAKQSAPISVVVGVLADESRPYANRVNRELATGFDADVILVGDSDTRLPVFASVFGGLKGERVWGVIGTAELSGKVQVLARTDNGGNLSEIDSNAFEAYKTADRTQKLSPYAFRNQVVCLAQNAKKRIVLPEGDEPRTIEAAAICQSRGIAQCVLLGDADKIRAVADERGVTLPDGIEIIEPATVIEKYVAPMVERRKGKIDEEGARQALQDTVYLGTMMLQVGDVDGLVSGAVHTTADTIRPAFQLIKTAPEYSLVSSVFFMLLPDQVVVYGDCAVNPNPTAEQLAEITIQSAESAKSFGIDPKVALISYSTMNSGSGEDVEMVKSALQIVREKAPSLKVDGPLQFDAASVPSVGKQKAPNSQVAGEANVFIFPDLNTGNTTYKAVQRTAGVISVGPMLQGLNKPVNDLSRGCLVDDIVYTIALTAIQAVGQ